MYCFENRIHNIGVRQFVLAYNPPIHLCFNTVIVIDVDVAATIAYFIGTYCQLKSVQ